MITDDLQAFPVSTGATFQLLVELGIADATVLEERSVYVGAAEVLDCSFLMLFFFSLS